MLGVFVREKPAKIVMILKDTTNQWHLSKIAAATGTTYVYVTKFISNLERKGLVTIEQKGKMRLVKLTDKGLVIVNLIDELRQKLEESVRMQQQSTAATPA